MPGTLINNYKFVICGLILFWGTAIGTYFAVLESPEYASTFLPESVLEYMVEMYDEPIATGRTGVERAQMSAYYIQHNTSIAFLCFATSIYLGLGTIYFLVYNGVFLGCIFGYLASIGLGPNIMEFVTAHSFLELNAIAIAGAAGMKLGFSLLNSWKNYSKDYLRNSKNDILTLVAASSILLFIAAIIEGNISPSTLDYSYKLMIFIISIVITISYFVIYPLWKLRQK